MKILTDVRKIDIFVVFISAILVTYLLWIYPLNLTPEDKQNRTFFQIFSLFSLIFVSMFGVGIIVHRILGVRSALSWYMGINDKPLRIL